MPRHIKTSSPVLMDKAHDADTAATDQVAGLRTYGLIHERHMPVLCCSMLCQLSASPARAEGALAHG